MSAAAPSVVVCPRDGAQLVEVERDGVMIDACPACRGIWLDRGELEKLIAHGDGGERVDEEEKATPESRKRRRGGFLENFLGDFGGD